MAILNPSEIVAGGGQVSWQLPRIGVVGASISAANAYAVGETDANYGAHGWLNWARIISGGRIKFETFRDMKVAGSPKGGSVVAVSGYTSATILETLVPIALQRRFDVVLLEAGGNDAISDAEAIAVDIALEQAFLSKGVQVWRLPITPRSSGSFDLRKQQRMRANLMAQRAAVTPGLRFIDWRVPVVDLSLADGAPRADCVYDERHLNAKGAFRVGKFIAEEIVRSFPAVRPGIVMNDDAYDAAINPYGNAFSNPLMLGTGGTVVPGGTNIVVGQAANDMRARRVSGAGTAVSSVVTRTDQWGSVGNWGQLVITPANAAGLGVFNLERYMGSNNIDVPNPYPVGTWAQLEIDCEVDAGGQIFTDVRAVAQTIGGTQRNYRSCQSSQSVDGDTGLIPNEAWSGRLVTPPFEILADTTAIRQTAQVQINNASATPATVRFGGFRLKKVEDMPTTWPGPGL